MMNRDDDGWNSTAVRMAVTRLAQFAPGDRPETLVDVLGSCMGVATGLLITVKPGPKMSMTHHVLRLPRLVLEGWAGTPPDALKRALYPAIHSSPGDFWNDRDGLPEKVRNDLQVLHFLDDFGLGVGAGFKLMCQSIPGGGEEHLFMAMHTQRGELFPRQTSAMCRVLAPALQQAIFRLSLPFTVGTSIHAQVLEEDAVGFVCLGADGGIIELNQRAYELASKYRSVAKVRPGRLFMNEFVAVAAKATKGGRVWQLMHPSHSAMLQGRMYVLPKEKFNLADNLPMIKLEEWTLPSLTEPEDFVDLPVFSGLTKREREIAALLVTRGPSTKEIADELRISPMTVRKHIEKIHKSLGVRSLGELIALVRKSRN